VRRGRRRGGWDGLAGIHSGWWWWKERRNGGESRGLRERGIGNI
jgi:hypothetical protein